MEAGATFIAFTEAEFVLNFHRSASRLFTSMDVPRTEKATSLPWKSIYSWKGTRISSFRTPVTACHPPSRRHPRQSKLFLYFPYPLAPIASAIASHQVSCSDKRGSKGRVFILCSTRLLVGLGSRPAHSRPARGHSGRRRRRRGRHCRGRRTLPTIRHISRISRPTRS